ncbi:MAG: PpiC-type peptidyl-prolyl cis-trans isomerase [Conexibacter sp.]|nr:PpiC-type peptidyl-prolyl cis-trans isomerase [Conexibacter sp.]
MNSFMPKTFRIILALGAFFVLALAVAACGGSSSKSVPDNAIATVDGTPVTRADYTRWYDITARSSAQQGQAAVVPDPPTYARCIAALQAAATRARARTTPTAAQLRTQCRTQDTQTSQTTIALLVQADWLEKEAKSLGVTVTDSEVARQLATTKRQAFPTDRAYRAFLTTSGMTERDILFRLRVQALSTRIGEKIQRQAAPVTAAQISAYYDRNRSQFSVPERRDIEVILTRTQAQANSAKQAVQSGTSWRAAAKKYSIDTVSKGNGGVLRGVARGQQDRALDSAAFSAQKGRLIGPIRGQFGWYLVRVTNITPARQNTLAQSQAQIRQVLTQQGQQRKITAFASDFQRRWTSRTQCAKGFVIPVCANAPKARRTTSTAGGTVATAPSTTGR